MTILGNIFLALATLVFPLFGISVLGKEPPRGGDAAMGYGWGIIIFNLIFLGCMTVVAIAIAWKGGFDWIAPNKGARFLLVAGGLLAAMITATLSALFKGEPGATAAIFRVFSGFAPALIPLILIITSAILLNDGLRTAVPMSVYKIPLLLVFWVGMLGVGAGLVGWMVASNQNAMNRLEAIEADQARYHQDHLNAIDTCDVTRNMSNILVYTDANHDQEVRDSAIAKIKTNPNWQQELVRLLENKGALEAFDFLASNEVNDKALFLAPVNTGVLSVAEWVRRQIREASQPHHFYEDQFSWQVERVLRTVDQFEGLGFDYRPVVGALRAAFDEPAETQKPKFRCLPALDNWIKKHQ